MSFEPSFFVLRTPLLPFEEFLAWGEGLETSGVIDDDKGLSEALERDRDRLRKYLHAVFSRPEAREALLIASSEFAEAFGLWKEDPESKRGQGIERALVRYFARMAGRPTPFGLFAGVSVGVVGEQTQLEVAGLADYRRSSRLDLGYLFALLERLRADPDLRKSLTFRPNATLYPAEGRLRYVESRLDGAELRHELVAVGRSDALDSTLARAEQGATLDQLAQLLASKGGSLGAAESFVQELVDNDLLVPELALPVTGPEPLDALVEELNVEEAAGPLREARKRLRALDDGGVGGDPEEYKRITGLLEPLQVDHEGSLFQVDLFKPAPNASLGQRVVDELLRGVEALRLLSPTRAETDLDRFREAFESRYEGREVPLVEALDPDLGIGFPPSRVDDAAAAPLIAGLPFPAEESRKVKWGAREDLLVRKLAASKGEVVLEKVDFEGLNEDASAPLPDSFAVTAAVAARSQESLDRGDFRVLFEGAYGPSGAVVLGRFCNGDPELRLHVEEHLRTEEALRPDAIFAEVVHLPQGRMGNVVSRPVLREYEIATGLGRPGAPLDRRITVDDLWISLRGGELVLRSERLGRRVIPRMTNAHNFGLFGIPIYRLLAFLQQEGCQAGLGWSWEPLEAAPFLPRVRFGRLVLSRARWNLTQEELRGLAGFRELQSLRRERGLPRLVGLREGDWLLPLDLDNVLSVESFVHLVRSREGASLDELFPSPDELVVEGPEGAFVHELVVPFVRAPAGAPKAGAAPVSTPRTVARRFAPGSEWVSAALFLGPAIADQVLLESVAPLAQELVNGGAADRWFFIRYGDPDWHLRIRFHGSPEIRPAVEAALSEQGWRLRIETYEREVERYGGAEGIELAEEIFHADSDAVVELLSALEDQNHRWRMALLGMDSLLTDLRFELEAKERIARRLRDAFGKEHRIDTRFREKLGQRFRNEREELEGPFDAERPEALQRRSERLTPLAERLRGLERDGRLIESVETLAESFLHMHANRLLRSGHRKQELVLYDFLARLYRAQLARREA